MIVDPPKVEIPKPMPPLPVVYGVMGLPSGTKAIMSEKTGAPSTTIRAGDTIGEFKIAALDPQNVTFEWNGKQVTRKIDDLIDRSNSQTASNGSPAPAAAARPADRPSAPPPSPAAPARPATAADLGDATSTSTRAVKPGDTSPVGSVVDGYKKTCMTTPFGTHMPMDQAVTETELIHMKTSITLLTLFASGLLMAQSDPKPADKDTAKKAAAKKPGPLTIPKDAVHNQDGTYSYTDKAGKKWRYVNTPFGVMRSEEIGPCARRRTGPLVESHG